MKTAFLICVALASSGALAQTPPPTSTNPSSASSPHQRETTRTPAKETATPSNPAATPTSPAPSAASSPHQQHVTEGADKTKAHEKMMKDCIAKQQSTNSTMSQDAAKKACTAQMKSKEGS